MPHPLIPDLERLVTQALNSPHGAVLDPGVADHLSRGAADAARRQEDLGHPACLLVPDSIRAPVARLLKRGVKLRAFPQPVMDACLKACREVLEEEAAKNANFRKLYEHYRRFQDQQNQCASVTEARMENYQINALQSSRS